MKSNWRSLKAHEIISSTEFNNYTFGIFAPNYVQKILILIGKKSFLKKRSVSNILHKNHSVIEKKTFRYIF